MCNNGRTYRDAVLGGPEEACITRLDGGATWQIRLKSERFARRRRGCMPLLYYCKLTVADYLIAWLEVLLPLPAPSRVKIVTVRVL